MGPPTGAQEAGLDTAGGQFRRPFTQQQTDPKSLGMEPIDDFETVAEKVKKPQRVPFKKMDSAAPVEQMNPFAKADATRMTSDVVEPVAPKTSDEAIKLTS